MSTETTPTRTRRDDPGRRLTRDIHRAKTQRDEAREDARQARALNRLLQGELVAELVRPRLIAPDRIWDHLAIDDVLTPAGDVDRGLLAVLVEDLLARRPELVSPPRYPHCEESGPGQGSPR